MEYEIENEEIKLKILSFGAQMASLKRCEKEYLWQGDKEYWSDQAPNLFPFVGRLTNGIYFYKGKEYQMDIHGFAKDMEYFLVYKDDTEIELELRDTEKTRKMYPFQFIFSIRYRLEQNKVVIEYNVTNMTNDLMYFGVGGHPGFFLPLDEGVEFDEYYLEFGIKHTPTQIGHSSDCFLNGLNFSYSLVDEDKLQLSHSLFDNDAIVLGNVSNCVTLKSDKGNSSITLEYPKMSYLGIWHIPKKQAPYICLEPWTSLPSRQGIVEEFSSKSDLICLEYKEKYSNKWSITVN